MAHKRTRLLMLVLGMFASPVVRAALALRDRHRAATVSRAGSSPSPTPPACGHGRYADPAKQLHNYKHALMVMVFLAISCLPSAQAPQPWKWPTQARGSCEYHPTPSGSIALVATVTASSTHLKGDGRGAYWEGNDTVRSYTNVAYNLFTYWPETCDQPLPAKVRSLEMHLDAPIDGARDLTVIRDQDAMIHVFPTSGSLQGMAVGASDATATAVIRFNIASEIYFLQFGPGLNVTPGMGDRGPTTFPAVPNPAPPSNGRGTTAVRVSHPMTSQWLISTPPDGVGRLSRWDPNLGRIAESDFGRYRFGFEMMLSLQRPTVR